MKLKDFWKPRVDGVDDADSSAVNEIADAVIEAEKDIEKLKNQSGGDSSYAEYAENAGKADFAYTADADSEGRTLKGNEIVDEGDTDTVELSLTDGFTFRYGIISDSLIVYTDGDWAYEGLDCALYFTTPSVMPENYSQFIGNVCFKGDSVDDRAFVPEKNTRYTIYFDFDGNMVVGYVSGVPAPSEEDE